MNWDELYTGFIAYQPNPDASKISDLLGDRTVFPWSQLNQTGRHICLLAFHVRSSDYQVFVRKPIPPITASIERVSQDKDNNTAHVTLRLAVPSGMGFLSGIKEWKFVSQGRNICISPPSGVLMPGEISGRNNMPYYAAGDWGDSGISLLLQFSGNLYDALGHSQIAIEEVLSPRPQFLHTKRR